MFIHIVANAAIGQSLSGGDRIFMECAGRWASRGHRVLVYVWEEGLEMCKRNRLEGVEFVLWPAGRFKKYGFALNYMMRTVEGSLGALRKKAEEGPHIVYSASDFWPDSIPAYLLSKRLKANWIAGFYLFAPAPFKGFRGAHAGRRLPDAKALCYYLHQKPVYKLINKKADAVFVTCEDDREVFLSAGRAPQDVVTVRGGVDAFAPVGALPLRKDYDACFVGRFHPQKGVLELVGIWEDVVKRRPSARLALIGADSARYRKMVEEEISSRGLEKRIDLLGFMDGEDKYRIFRRSRVIVHPAVYDSGGMAACEGMAWGLPAVGFDLPALKRYYPKGMLKAPVGSSREFARLILRLLEDEQLYERTRDDAVSLAKEWDWGRRADELLSYMEKRFGTRL
ncbi:MAG TPA: hypothetical protein DDW94_12190 [Deltaproteobacteria bacterium]|nr:MAG: hypothetical protein A2Z79_08335 [Deltaproteobacteria bacterium GWA2_55_82]OGQ63128.1 MAG: hypothetical protein A3I81_09965 [Deltaproteobacteria bacterium RIFCSPLOWO2_02_FULL_55_12]OIJ73593.1 MAG: hypothetical protein A2V21_304530 [Deltaproteobacteria bacterium GWC2_55_46]HBG47728.1 hypothetical protein [Deltaproteobacteria bacterium]HCY12050.1 hypothetical protein [Deltaproteobacteria bacterium]